MLQSNRNRIKLIWFSNLQFFEFPILYYITNNTMKPNVRHKSRSLPFLRCRIYQKIGAKFLHEKWRQLLNKQLQLQWPIRQLSKTQFDVNNHSHQKFSVRQNLIMKKEIIKCLEKAQISIAMHKLEELKNKMAIINQQKGAEMMIMYLDCHRKILQDLKVGREEEVIHFVRDKLARFLGDADLCMMKIKCMTILCILMLRFHGILMTTDERNIIFKTIQLKKKKFLYLDLQQQRQSQFESLLYLLEELYKLLFLLKKDQHLILNYYNQLHAYTEIYLQNHHEKGSNIDVFQISKTLKDMKPIMSDLNIYQDSKLRKQLAVAHIKDEIVEKKQRHFTRRSVDFGNRNGSIQISTNSKMGSSQKMTSSSKLKLDNCKETKLRLEVDGRKKNSNISIIPEQSMHQNMNELSLKGISFKCLLPIKEKIYIVKNNIGFRNGFSLVDLTLTIEKQHLSCEIYKLRGIEMCLLVLNLDGIAKFIEEMFSKLFGNAHFFELHNLITEDLQKNLYLEQLVPAMVRCKAILKQYFRRNNYEEFINGSKFIYPKINVVDLKKEIEKSVAESIMKMQKVNFVKRKGLINRDQALSQKQNFVDLRGIIVKRMDECSQYVLFGAHFKIIFKGLDLFHFEDGTQLDQLPLYIKELKRISYKGVKSRQSVTIAKCINQILSVHVEQEKLSNSCVQYRVQQELQINQKKLNCQTIRIERYSKLKRKTKKQKQHSSFQIIRTNKLQYILFRKDIAEGCVVYKNEKTKICVSNKLNCNYKLIKKRIRMYNSIKLVLDHKNNTDGSLTVLIGQREQTFVLTFVRHYVVKKKRGFFMILIYQCPTNEYLYEIVHKFQRFFFTSYEYLSKKVLSQANIEDRKVGIYQLKTFEIKRIQISEANQYYLNLKNMKVPTKKQQD